MSYRQRNIPVTSKEEVSVQTDVRLLQPNLLDRQQQQQQQHQPPSQIKLSRLHDKSGLLRPFSDQHLLRQFSKTLSELQTAQPGDNVFAKRLQLLQNQINGLLKRDLLINGVAEGSQTWNSYYLTLNQKQKAIIRLQNQKLHSDAKIQRLRQQIQHLQKELNNLRSSLVNSQKAVEQNKLYASLYEKINQTLTKGKNKAAQLEQIIAEYIVPLTSEFQFNLAAITRNINRNTHQSIKTAVSNLAREFDRLLKEPQFTQEKLSDTLLSLINNFKAVKGVDYLKNQFHQASRAQEAQDNYKNMLSLLKHEINTLKNQPQSIHKFDSLLRRLQEQGIQLFDCKGWINLVSPQIKIVEVNSEDKKLKQLIGVLASEFKHAYSKFPALKNHVSAKLIDLFESQALVELIEGGSIQKLSQIIIHEVETVRVQNVYQYESSSSQKTVFHLRVLLKRLLQELDKIKKTHAIDFNLDEGILQLLKNHIIDGFNTEDYISLFRPIPKIIQVPIVVDRLVYETKTFEKGIPINIQSQIVLRQQKATVVTINKEVPVYIQKPIDHVINQNIPVTVQTQKAVPVEVVRELLTERTVQSAVEVLVVHQKSVGLYQREQVVRQVEVEKVVQKVEFKQVQKIIQTGGREYIQVEKIVQKPVYLYETRQQIKQVQVRVPQIVRQTEYIQIQKKVPYIIQHKQIVNFDREIPIQIRVPEIEIVEVIEYRDKPIVVKEYKEVVKQIPITKQKELLRETPKQIFIERSHFIKADQVEIIREVQVYVDKPIIRQILTSKDTEVDKIVPLYISEQVPVIHEISVPYVSQRVKQLKVQRLKLVPVKEQIIKPVHIEKPVPVVVQKQIVKVQTQIVQRIIEKIVEVPRVVQIQKIVQKIVVVPRIVQRIVQVPKIIEKIIVVEQPVLQIVEIQVPYIVIQEVDRLIEVIVEKVVVEIQKQIQIVQIQRIVERIIQRDRPVEVQLERRIPYEVIRQVAVPTYRDRVEYIKRQINQTKVQTIEVQVPILFQQKVPFYVQKPIVTEHVIEQPVYEKIYVEKQKVIVNEVEKLVVREIVIEKPVVTEVIKEVPGPETIKYIYEPKIVEVIKERIVQLHDKVEVPKEIYLLQEKIVHEIHQKMLQVPVNSIVMTPQLVQVPKLIYLTHYKQIAVDVPVRQERIKRDIVQQIKAVQVIKEVPVEVQIYKQKIREITNDIRQYITSEIVKQIHSQVQVRSPVQYQVVEVVGKTVVQQLYNTNRLVQTQDKIIERVIQKIVMLPQIVEVVKNIHHISQVNSLGVAVNEDINVQTQKYRAVSQELRKSLLQLLKNFRSNVARQPDLKNLIGIIEKHVKIIDNWISFPKLIEIPKEVLKQVEKEKVVLVPTADKQKEAVLSYILQKLLNQLRRINQQHKIQLSLDDELLKIFFPQNTDDKGLDHKLDQLSQSLKSRLNSFGDWSQSNPFLVNAFLQDHFSLRSLIEQANKIQQQQVQQINSLRHQADIATNKYENLLYYNRKIFDDNLDLINLLQKYRNSISNEQFNVLVEKHREFYDQLVQQKPSFLASSIKRIQKYNESIVEEYDGEQDPNRANALGELVGKINQYEDSNQKLLTQTKLYQNQLQKSKQELSIRNNIIKRLQDEFQLKVSRRKDDLAKSPNVNKELIQQNKQLQEQNKTLSRQASTQKLAADRSKKELERSVESIKKDYEAKLDKKEKEIKEVAEKIKKQNERQLNKIKQDLERLKKQKQKLEAELIDTRKKTAEQIKLTREQRPTSSDKYSQLLNENVDLRKKSEILQQQFQKLKQAASDNNSINDQQLSRLKQQNEKLISERRQSQKKKKEGIFGFSPETGKKNVQLTRKIQNLEAELKNKDQRSAGELKALQQKVKQLEIELQNSKRQVEAAQKSQLQSPAFRTSGIKPTTSIIQHQGQGSVTRTPGSGVRQSLQKGYMSPQITQGREETGEVFGSPQSRLSQQSSEQGPTYYKPKMNLREFMEAKHNDKDRDMYITFVMIKIIEKIELQVDTGRYNSYSPSNIFLINFNVANLEQLSIKFGYPIKDKNFKTDGLYLSPEVLAGGQSSKRSTVFSLGVILDELIHGNTFFKSVSQIQNAAIEFKVRGDKLNPILKNTLFQMMNKEPNKRLELLEAKRRLSLQKYITTEGRGSMTSSSRLGRG